MNSISVWHAVAMMMLMMIMTVISSSGADSRFPSTKEFGSRGSLGSRTTPYSLADVSARSGDSHAASAWPAPKDDTGMNLWPTPQQQNLTMDNCWTVSPAAFRFVSVGFTDNTLTQAIDRYTKIIFMHGAGGPFPGRPNNFTTVFINVTSSQVELALTTNESYNLTIGVSWSDTTGTGTLSAPTVYGALRGLETLSQSIAYDLDYSAYFTCFNEIVDYPRFPYRGILLDVSRHFFPIATLQNVIDTMAFVKLNTLHLHLTDDQSWPLEIKSYPLLSYWTSFSNHSHTYTQALMSELVEYARLRGVRVIPEIESPSHSSCIGIAYPPLTSIAFDQNNNSFNCLVDPSNPQLYTFWESLWGEVASTFTSDVLHLGGDEFWDCWSESPKVAAWMAAHNWTAYDAYNYYEQRVYDIVRATNRSVMAWQDVAGFPPAFNGSYNAYPDLILEVWTGCYSGNWQDDVGNFTAQNASVVLAGPYYITNPPTFTWEQMYNTDPFNTSTPMTPLQEKHVLGGELCAWDDAVSSDAGDIQVDITPFLFGVSETWWSSTNITHSPPDKNRAHYHRCRLINRGVPSHPIYGYGAYCSFEYSAPPVLGSG